MQAAQKPLETVKRFFHAILPFIGTGCLLAQAPDISTAPEPIQKLAKKIASIKGSEIHGAIVEQFGKAHRQRGFGLMIEEWDVAGGVLEFRMLNGPIYKDSASKTYRLLPTASPVAENILSEYEMTARPGGDGNACGWVILTSVQTAHTNSSRAINFPRRKPSTGMISSSLIPLAKWRFAMRSR